MDNKQSEDYTKRASLTVKNETPAEDAKAFYLDWSEDTDESESRECAIEVGQECKKYSKGIGNGGNCRTFNIKVYKKNVYRSHTYIGEFSHSVLSAPGSVGGSEKTSINVNYFDDYVSVYRKWIIISLCPKEATGIEDPVETSEEIGTISYEEWDIE